MDPHRFRDVPRFGIAGNMAGHLEQAGEAGDFTQVEAAAGQPKGIFPTYIPGSRGFLGVDPVSFDRLRLPRGSDAARVQAEPELALFVALDWLDGRVAAVRPLGFTAYNDASIRKPAPKISIKKNWGAATKGFAPEVVPLETLEIGGPLDRYNLVAFLRRDGVLRTYGEDSPVQSYACFHASLLTWIAEKLNDQAEEGPLEHLAALLHDQPAGAVIGIGATRYTPFAADDRLQAGDEVIVAVYDRDSVGFNDVRARVQGGIALPAGNPVLRQRVE
ncbi:MAG: DUF5718 family protein [Myxococcota bacterium]|nr:DUF5718 family protein [Myxococcota bacterium]MEC8422685.1 DUF5718 family protein [Myxococcota bacterium]